MKKYYNEDDWQNYSYESLEYFVKKYEHKKSALNKIKAAYDYAKKQHTKEDGTPVRRNSGEPYINHPVAVANFAAIMKMDVNSICAALLHDTIEDTSTTYEDIEKRFGTDVADLVEGLTKISEEDIINEAALHTKFSDDVDENLKLTKKALNQRKITDSLVNDIRIIILKLLDRLHNMLTIKFKTRIKQRSKAIETLLLYVPLANIFGIYKIQQQLENASFRVLAPKLYEDIEKGRKAIKDDTMPLLEEMLDKMTHVIEDNVNTIGHFQNYETIGKTKESLRNKVLFIGPKYSRARIKHVYGIYDALSKLKTDREQDTFDYVRGLTFNEETLDKIHDLRVIKLIVKDEISCYLVLRYLHQTYPHVDKYFKDYISCPKYNGYQSIHTTVIIDGKYVQFQIRTPEQELRNTYGIAWELYKFEGPNIKEKILEEFKKNPAYKRMLEIKENESNMGLTEYKSLIDKEILNTKLITVVNKVDGTNVTIVDGSTIRDFAYNVGGDLGNHLVSATLNDEKYSLDIKDGVVNPDYYPFDIMLKNGDEISVKFDENIICPSPITKEKKVEEKKSTKKLLLEDKKVEE